MPQNNIGDQTTQDAKQSINAAKNTGKAIANAPQNAKKAVKAGKAVAKASATAAKAIAANPYVLIGACVLTLVIFVMVAMSPATSFNSWTHINETQDEVDDDEKKEDGTISGFAPGQQKALEAEGEGVNLIYHVLKGEEEEAYDELKKICDDDPDVDYEATLAFMQKFSAAPTAADIFGYTDNMDEGVFTQDQFDATEILSAYSVSVDNLWDKDYLGDPNETLSLNLSSINTSTMEGRAKYLYAYMRKKGLSHNAACGILGNIEAESSFNPSVVNGIGAKGIVQWYLGRAKKLDSYAKKKGTAWNNFKTQVDFMWSEFQGKYKRSVYTKLKKSKISLYKATDIICGDYEVPEIRGTNAYKKEMANRYAYAKKWSKKFSNMSLDVSGGINTSNIDAPTAGAKGAVAWARAIAKDDSFTYGAKPVACRGGCYFCGTNVGPKKYKKGKNKRFAKTYCCNPFIFSAYAHGANDPKCLKKCKKGGNAQTGMRPKAWEKYNFKYIGKPSWSKIKAGDVCIKANHVWMITDPKKGLMVHAHGGGWDAGSISENKGAKAYYNKKCKYVVRYVGNGNGIPNTPNIKVSNTGGSSGTSASASKGAKGALAWAKKIANDNSYVYGGSTCPQCNKNAHKEYVCTTFVKAAFAHGAGDSEMKKWCKGAKYGWVSDLEAAMEKSKNWAYIGKFNKKKLKAGDVVFRGTGHVVIYYGNGKVVHASDKKANRKNDILIDNWYAGNWTSIYRYVGKGGKIGTNQTYKKHTVIKTLNKKDLTKYISSKGTAKCPTAQSMAYMGGQKVAVVLNDVRGNMKGSNAIIRIYNNGKRRPFEKSFKDLDHANGTAYNPNDKTLYVVSGLGSKNCFRINGETLKMGKNKKLKWSAGSIAYDTSTNQFSIGSGNKILVSNKDLSKKNRTITKKGKWRYAQDQGAHDGIIYSCVSVDKHNKNYINMYSASTGAYYGSYAIGFDAEIEDCEVDAKGRLLILIHKKGTRYNYVYRTKEPMALTDGESDSEDEQVEGEPGNWRYDMPNKLKHYIQGERAKGKDPLYKWSFVEGRDGKPKKLEGVYDTSVDLEPIEEQKKIVADAAGNRKVSVTDTKTVGGSEHKTKEKKGVGANPHKIKEATDEQKLSMSANEVKNAEAQIIANQKAQANAKPKLKQAQYYSAILVKKDVVKLGFNAFGVSSKQIRKLYGPNVDGSEVVRTMAMDSLALLHGVSDFTNPIEARYEEDRGDKPYDIGKKLGNFEVEVVCGCPKPDCKKKREALLKKKWLKNLGKLSAGVDCFVSDTKDVKMKPGALIYNSSFGVLYVRDHMNTGFSKYMSGSGDGQLIIYGGKNHEAARKMRNKVRGAAGRVSRTGVVPINLVTGIHKNDAAAFSNLALSSEGSGLASGVFGLPVASGKYQITSLYGQRWGKLHEGIDVGTPVGTPIMATNGGTVTIAGTFGGYGKCIEIDHGIVNNKRVFTRYGHLSSINVKKGQKVSKGQTIAKSGNTGYSTGPHLHYEARIGKNKTAVDPMGYGFIKKLKNYSILK